PQIVLWSAGHSPFLCSARPRPLWAAPSFLVAGHGAISSRTSPPNVNSSNSSAAATGNSAAPNPLIASASRLIAAPLTFLPRHLPSPLRKSPALPPRSPPPSAAPSRASVPQTAALFPH